MTGDFLEDEIEECYVPPTPNTLDIELNAAIAALRKNTFTAEIASVIAFSKFIKDFPAALSTCTNKKVIDDVNKINDWAKLFDDPETLGKTM